MTGRRGGRSSAVISERARFHLAYRLVIRAYQLASGIALGTHSVRRASAVAASVAGDVLIWRWLQRRSRLALTPRVIVDASDTAAWSLAAPGGYDLATLTGVPLAAESGVRLGAKGLVVPAVNALVTAGVRRRLRRPLRLESFQWQVVAVVIGAALAAYEGRQRQVLFARHAQELEAKRRRAYLSGQNDVAVRADSIIDLLARTAPLVGGERAAGSLHRALLAWKASVAEHTVAHATYLATALAVWQRRHNDQPDLRADVDLTVPPDQGTVLLTPAQVAGLERALDGLPLSGRVMVAIGDPAAARIPGRSWQLFVDGHVLEVPADPAGAAVPFDPGPLVLLCAPVWFLNQAHPGQGGVPVIATIGPSLLSVVTGGWTHHRNRNSPLRSNGDVVLVATAIGLLNALVAAPRARVPFSTDGMQRFPFLLPLNSVAVLRALYAPALSLPQRVAAAAGVAATVVVGCTLLPTPLRKRHLAADLMWPTSAFVAASRLARTLEAAAAETSAELANLEAGAVSEAFAEGRSSVVALALEVRSDLGRRFSAVEHRLPLNISREVRRRLMEADRRLEALRCESG